MYHRGESNSRLQIHGPWFQLGAESFSPWRYIHHSPRTLAFTPSFFLGPSISLLFYALHIYLFSPPPILLHSFSPLYPHIFLSFSPDLDLVYRFFSKFAFNFGDFRSKLAGVELISADTVLNQFVGKSG